MNSNPVRVRFAPSPTGNFHVGGARTALFNYLFARHNKGTFILRIENTDQNRYDPGARDQILNGLRYLGLEWDEGPDIGGPFGPYTQSERFDLYREAAENLIASGHAYRCFCSPERLEKVRREREKAKLPHGYDRYCREINMDESRKRMSAGETFTVRIKLPVEGQTQVEDVILGDISFENRELQDSILMKADGTPTYHLANVVDDHYMEISHILRGSEWVNSLPLHINLYKAFGWEAPVMAHLPLILNPSGKGKLSKRSKITGDGMELPVFVHAFEEKGYLGDAMVNYLALLGWSFDDRTELMSREELIMRFTLERISSSPASWNYTKLDHINGQYIRAMKADALCELLKDRFLSEGRKFDALVLNSVVPLIQERIERLDQAWEKIDFFFLSELQEYDPKELLPKKTTAGETETILKEARRVLSPTDFSIKSIDSALRGAAGELGVKVGQMFQPVRVAACGKKVAPPLIETLEVLGKDTTLNRLEIAIQKLKSII